MTIPQNPNTYRAGPDERGHFGLYGGRFVAETLMPLILDLEAAYEAAKKDPAFAAELADLGKHYTGRPSPLYFAERLTEHLRSMAQHVDQHCALNVLIERISDAQLLRPLDVVSNVRGVDAVVAARRSQQ